MRFLDLRALSFKSTSICSTLWRFRSLVYVDLAFTDIDNQGLFQSHGSALSPHSSTLRALSLRGTSISGDNTCLDSLLELQNLAYLDLSKSSKRDAGLFVDLRKLASMSSLTWLNLSLTAVNDETVIALCRGLRQLKCLGLACTSVTDACIPALRDLSLRVLDISGCQKLTDEGFSSLLHKNQSRAMNSLVVLICAFLPHVSEDETYNVVAMPNLRKLDIRSVAISDLTKSLLKSHLDVAIFSHTDQLENDLPTMYDFVSIRDICPTVKWPYEI